MTMGTSAPPTGSTKRTPKARDSTSRTSTSQNCGSMKSQTPVAMVATATRMVIHLPAGMTTGRVVMISCNFRKVTIEPLKATEPMMIVSTVKREKRKSPWSPRWRYSTIAMRPAAPPPTPLKSATSCGIAVILTRRAEIQPMADPTRMAAMMRIRLSSSMPVKKSTTVATTAPIAPSAVPRRAVFGDDRPLSDRMNRTAAPRLTSWAHVGVFTAIPRPCH